jgi:hypothetical protein
VLLLGALVATMGCQQAKDNAQPAAGGEVVAIYTGHTLTSEQVKQEFERLPGPSRTFLTAPDRKRQFIENMVMNELLYDEGKREGLDKAPDIERQVNELRKRLVVQRVMRKYQTPPPITDEQVRASYDQNVDLYSTTQIAPATSSCGTRRRRSSSSPRSGPTRGSSPSWRSRSRPTRRAPRRAATSAPSARAAWCRSSSARPSG